MRVATFAPNPAVSTTARRKSSQMSRLTPVGKGGDAMSGSVRGLGEVALRVVDLDRMQKFYQDIIGLELLRRFERAAFFRLAEGFGGHTQVLALFDRTTDPKFV